jgi:flagellar motor switch protein FliN/FliY
MAEEIDPFEAAMAAMNGDSISGEGEDLKLDDLEAALKEDQPEPAADTGDLPGDKAEESPVGDDAPQSDDPFETAMAAMDAVATDDASADVGSDPFEAALQVTQKEDTKAVSKEVKGKKFDGQHIDIDFLMDIKMNLTFEVGRTKMFISDLLSLGQGSVIELHRLVGEELDLFVNGELLATGEVVVVNEKFGARIVQILTPENRLNRLAPTLKK